MAAYYNENDPFAAAWLRELIKAGAIADGDVDEHDIRDVDYSDIRGYRQVHLFAGLGAWSLALRRAGVRDDEPVWTGSCPCQPLSVAGKRKRCPACDGGVLAPHVGRTGYFVCCLCGHEWLADERHLWPEAWRLIRDGRPERFFGEQVESKDARTWFAVVQASLRILGYTVGGADTSAASFGAPHGRPRIYFVADSDSPRRRARWAEEEGGRGTPRVESSGLRATELGDTVQPGLAQRERHGRLQREAVESSAREAVECGSDATWSDTEWIPFRDGAYRATQSWAGPLDDGFAADLGFGWNGDHWTLSPLIQKGKNRVGRLRGYGNAICVTQAVAFIEAYLEICDNVKKST